MRRNWFYLVATLSAPYFFRQFWRGRGNARLRKAVLLSVHCLSSSTAKASASISYFERHNAPVSAIAKFHERLHWRVPPDAYIGGRIGGGGVVPAFPHFQLFVVTTRWRHHTRHIAKRHTAAISFYSICLLPYIALSFATISASSAVFAWSFGAARVSASFNLSSWRRVSASTVMALKRAASLAKRHYSWGSFFRLPPLTALRYLR